MIFNFAIKLLILNTFIGLRGKSIIAAERMKRHFSSTSKIARTREMISSPELDE